ncbi:MAG: hypothetical protein IKL05_05055 [Clostridia bacterium]|nr:hypothetical protein [Clostridia bacterium]
MKVSVIDIGSNTVKATIFKISNKGKRSVLCHKGFKSKLITYVEEREGKRFLNDMGEVELYRAVSELIAFSQANSCENVFAFATASLRNVENSKEIVQKLNEKFSLQVEILTGEEEALCSLRGLLTDAEAEYIQEGIMIDMGGGSTEIVYFTNGELPKLVSLPFGCLSLYERFVGGDIPDESEAEQIENYVRAELEKCKYISNLSVPVFLIGGSGRAVSKIINSGTGKKSLRSDGSDFTKILEKFKDADYLSKAEEIIPGRALTVCPASIAYRTIVRLVRPTSITVSNSGVREGYLEKILP